MKYKTLLDSAAKLKQPSAKSAKEYSEHRDKLAAEMNIIMNARKDIDKMIGQDNKEMMQDNHRNHARFMESLFVAYSPETFVKTVIWVFKAYRSHGFNISYWPAQLDTWVELLKKELSPEAFEEIYHFYNWMIVNQAAFVELSE